VRGQLGDDPVVATIGHRRQVEVATDPLSQFRMARSNHEFTISEKAAHSASARQRASPLGVIV